MKKIKLVIFDAGGVLYNDVKKRVILDEFGNFFLSYGYNIPKNLESIWGELYYMGRVGKLNYEDCQVKLLEKAGIDKGMIFEWMRFYENLWKRHAKTEEYINGVFVELKRIGYKLAILSDSVASKHEKKKFLELSGINYESFDEIFTSHDIGYAKPDKRSYLTVLEYFGHEPQETVFVGHDEDELSGAKNLGISTISVKISSPMADYIINNLTELSRTLLLLEAKL